MKASVISMVFTFVNIGISRCHVLLRTFGLQAIVRLCRLESVCSLSIANEVLCSSIHL